MSNNYSKQLSTAQITQKLDKLNYHFDDQYWNDFSQQYQGSRMQAVKMQAKFNPKFLAIPVGLIVIASIVYFSINNMRSENASKDPIVTTKTTDPIEKPKELLVAPVKNDAVKSEVKVVEVPKPVVVEETAKAKVKLEKKEAIIKVENNKVANNEVALVKQSVSSENTTTKKKKSRKGKNTTATIDAFVPSAEEDNVVIPEN